MKYKFSDFYFLSYDWFYSQFESVFTDQILKKNNIASEYAQCYEMDFYIYEFFFVRLLVYDI